MRPDPASMTERVMLLRQHCAAAAPSAATALLEQIEDALSEGYAEALAGDAWSISTENRLQQLIGEPDQALRGQQLRSLAHEHARFQRELAALRRGLAELRRDRDRLYVRSARCSAR